MDQPYTWQNASEQHPPSKGGRSRSGLIIASVLLVVLLLGGAALVWMLSDDDSGTDKIGSENSGAASKAVEQYFAAIVAEDEKTLRKLSCEADIPDFIDNEAWRQAYKGVEDFTIEVIGEKKDGEQWLVDFSYSATVEGAKTQGEESVRVVPENGSLKVCISETVGLLAP